MTVDVVDKQLRVRLYPIKDGCRMTIDYPDVPDYHSRVQSALANLLRPIDSSTSQEQV